MFEKKNKKKVSTEVKVPKLVKKKPRKYDLLSIISTSLLVLMHVVLGTVVFLTYRYYGIYPALFGAILGLALCFVIMMDVIFFVGLNQKVNGIKIVVLVMAILITITGSFGTYYILQINGAVNKVLDNGGDAYEKVSGVFVSNDPKCSYTDLSKLNGKKVGYVTETERGISAIGQDLVKAGGSDPIYAEYPTQKELFFALVDGNVDVAILTNGYRTLYSSDENNDYSQYLEKLVDFYTFDEDVKVTTNRSTKDLTKEPFNVLLIGWSRTDIGSTIGLADAIIVVTVNPKTLTASMMSIARDSFVPIPCYGGSYDKINSGRSTSRACFIDTVEEFLGMDMDFYVEADYDGIIYLVDAIGGVEINNPVDFEMDGYFVPAGKYVATGYQALEFCRERHHMPNGDFDRQQHQKEVIIEIVKKIVKSRDINLAMNAMKVVSNGYISTNMSLTQLTSIFNMIVNNDNNTGIDIFDLLDFHALRITGSGGIKYYSYSMSLPLWIYTIYKGSYDESIEHINEVMGNYKTINQDYAFSFSVNNPYVRQPFYSLDYPDEFMYAPEPMPDYWPDMVGWTLSEVMEWASEKGVNLEIEVIDYSNPNYNSKYEGLVASQSVRYGQLIHSKGSYQGYSSGKVTFMGSADESEFVPNFVGNTYEKFVAWADKYNVRYNISFDSDNPYNDYEVGEVVSQSVPTGTLVSEAGTIKVVVKAGKFTVNFNTGGKGETPASITVKTGDAKELPRLSPVTVDGVKYSFAGWYTEANGGTKLNYASDINGKNGSTVTIYARWNQQYVITLDANGGYCDYSSIVNDESLPSASRSHYSFAGWYTAASGGSKVTDPSTLTSATTLYAQYTELPTYYYEFVDGGTVVDSGTLYTDEYPSEPGMSDTEDYHFAGWSASGSRESGSVTYTAIWELIPETEPESEETE